MKDSSILYYLWLGSKLYPGSAVPKLLLEGMKDISEIYHATREQYMTFGLSPSDCARLCDKDTSEAEHYYDYCEKEHIGLLPYDAPYYPGRLKAIQNPPPILYYRGRVELIDDFPCFAMVGTRTCSEKGFRTAYRTSYAAAVGGAVVVNGLALGCDTACMRGALDAGGYAIGLLGCGIDRIYPSQNKELFFRLSRQGLILSEFPPFTRPEGRNFPVRNRVISALSVATVVFEAGLGSGALITAEHALSQGRRIFAVPGNIHDSLYEGPLGLIKDGAQIFTEAADILAEYSLMFPHRIKVNQKLTIPSDGENAAVRDAFSILEKEKEPSKEARTLPKPQRSRSAYSQRTKPEKEAAPPRKAPVKTAEAASTPQEPTPPEAVDSRFDLSILSPDEMKIYSLFTSRSTWTVDEIAAQGIKIDDALSSLTLLEVYGLIHSLPGGRYERD